MERQHNTRRMRRRRRKRFLRKIVIFVYRCICLSIVAGLIILGINIHHWLSDRDAKTLSANEYPESLISLLEKNPETKEFVLGYPENKDKEYKIDLSDEVTKGEIPLFLQWDERWGYETYGSDFMAITGCGPTCLAMVQCGLSGQITWDPLKVAKLAEEEGYYVNGSGSSWDLMTTGAAMLGLAADSVIYDAPHIIEVLVHGSPIICIMGQGDFTTSGHFIVLTGVDEEGRITVCDPNSKQNSETSWDVNELVPQIRNLWSYRYTG